MNFANGEEVREDTADKWLIDQMIKQTKEKGKMSEYQEDILKRFCKEKEYRWIEVKKEI